jgi:hypothetical protein
MLIPQIHPAKISEALHFPPGYGIKKPVIWWNDLT